MTQEDDEGEAQVAQSGEQEVHVPFRPIDEVGQVDWQMPPWANIGGGHFVQ